MAVTPCKVCLSDSGASASSAAVSSVLAVTLQKRCGMSSMAADSTLRMRKIADVARVLCAAPSYIASRGNPVDGAAIIAQGHECLNLRYPGAPEFQWPLRTAKGVKRFRVSGRFESDDVTTECFTSP